MKDKTEDPCEQMKQISKAVLGFEEGKFEDILTGIKMLSDDCDRLRREIDNLTGVIR